MLNHETTSIAREKQEEYERYCDIDTSVIHYSRLDKTLYYLVHKYLTGGTSYKFEVTRQKQTYYQGGWLATGEGGTFEAYTLKMLKAKIVDYIESALDHN